jgi:hypothetical protein
MNELLKKLLEAEILSEDSKKELEEAFQTQLNEVIEATKAETAEQVRLELSEQWVTDKEQLIEAIDAKVNEYLLAEVQELKDDISSFRDLEAEYAVKLTEAKKALGVQLEADMVQIIDKLDSFLEMRLRNEFKELKADLLEAKKLDFGRRIFESFMPEYRKYFVDATATERELHEAKIKIDKLSKKYKNVKGEKDCLFRKVKLESILAPLTGRQRDVMETILASKPTDKLEEAYKTYISRVIKEGVDVSAKTETTKTSKKTPSLTESVTEKSSVVKTGDTNTIVENRDDQSGTTSQTASYYKRLAGI